MKQIIPFLLVGILLFSGFGAVANSKNICEGISDLKNQKTHHFLEEKNETEREKLTSIDFFFHGSKMI